MNIKPVANVVPSPIPTAAEAAADPGLVAPAPSVRPRRGIGALVGAGLIGSLLGTTTSCTGRQAEVPAGTPATARAVPDPADADAAARAEEARKTVATVVAPMLQKALDEEGRGAFGCVAVDPPEMLSEADALELIRQEFAKAGVELGGEREIPGFLRTVPDRNKAPRRSDKARPWLDVYPVKTVPGKWTFDLATEDGRIAVEYLSLRDEANESLTDNFSTVSDADLPELAQRLGSEFATRTNGESVAIGVFFDPLASRRIWDEGRHAYVLRPGSCLNALSEEEREALGWREAHELLLRDAREMLREQVKFFLEWARETGRIP